LALPEADDLLVDLIADVSFALGRTMSLKAGRRPEMVDGRIRHASVLIAYILDEKQDKDVVLCYLLASCRRRSSSALDQRDE